MRNLPLGFKIITGVVAVGFITIAALAIHRISSMDEIDFQTGTAYWHDKKTCVQYLTQNDGFPVRRKDQFNNPLLAPNCIPQ